MSFADSLHTEASSADCVKRALALIEAGAVARCDAVPGYMPGTMRLDGTVRDEAGAWSGGSCRLFVSLDLDDEQVTGYQCTGRACHNQMGMCEHALAVTLTYLDEAGIEPLASAAGIAGGPGSVGVPKRALPTDQRISNLLGAIMTEQLDQSDAARRSQLQDRGAAEEPVDVEVTLMPVERDIYHNSLPSVSTTWLMKLKLRRGKAAYVVKNMDQLAVAYQTGEELSHGKNLTFAHVPGAFTERARHVLDLVVRVVESQHALFASRAKYRDVGKGTEIKDLPVSSADVVGVLDLMQGATVTFDPRDRYRPVKRYLYGCAYDGPEDKPFKVDVVEGDPAIPAQLAPADDGGYDLELPRMLDCFTAGGKLYVLDESHAWRCSEDFARAAIPVLGTLLPATSVHIGRNDLPGFLRTALPALRRVTRLDEPDHLEDLMPPQPEFSFRVGMDEGVVFCDATVSYAGDAKSLYDPQEPGQQRDLVAEYRAMDAVGAYFPERDASLPYFDERDDELLYLLLTEGLRELSGLGEVLLNERLAGITARPSPQVGVHAVVKSGLLNLEVSAAGLSPRDLMAYLASYKRKERYLRLSNGDIMRLDGSVRALNDLAEGLGVQTDELVGGTVGLPSNRTLFVDALLRKADGVRLTRNDAFRAVVRDFETFSDADIETPGTLREVLRPYQDEGMRWLGTLERFGFGGILADDMGLGKTLQMIAHILARKEAGASGCTLVVCPASLVYNWMAELERFAPGLSAAAVVGTKAARRLVLGGHGERDVLVTSYDLLKRDVEEYAGIRFARVVLDEAQYVKNAQTQAAKAVKCLQAEARFALTGTPIENRLMELWSIFDFLMPGLLGTPESFTKRFADAAEAREEGAARRLQLLVSPFILRRLKADVLADLPEKNESVVFARMEGEQARLYTANQDRLALQIAHELPAEFKKNKLAVLAELTKLRQICCDPRLYYEDYTGGSAKLETAMELVRSAVDAGHAVLLFSQFTSMLQILGERLDAEKIGHLVLTGATSKEERARLVARFQAGEEKVFLISLKAGGVGLNLTAADVVIHYDPWWNLAAQNQATDRAHRIGQDRAVSVFKLIAKDSIEEKIVAMQESKRDLAESVLGGEEVRASALDRDGVLALLGAIEG